MTQSIEREVLLNQLVLREKQLPFGLAVAVLAASIAVWVFWGELPFWLLLGWFGARVLISITNHLYTKRDSDHSNKSYAQIKRRSNMQTLWGFLAAVLWAFTVVFLISLHGEVGEVEFLQRVVFVTLLLVALVSGRMSTDVADIRSFNLFALTCVLPLSGYFLYLGSEIVYIAFSLVSLLYIFAVCAVAANTHRQLIGAFRLEIENRSLAQKYKEQKDAAEKSNLAKSRFLAAASHDLRQPLYALELYAESLKDNISPEYVEQTVEGIGQTTESLCTMLDTILDLSKIQSQTVKPELRPVSLQSIFDTAKANFEKPCAEKGLSLNVVPTSVWVNTEPALMTRVVMNLLSNAVRYTHVNELGEGKIVLGCRRKSENTVSILVADTGEGISESDQALIFEEYYQANNPERDRNKGLGLGLSIVKGLLASVNSRIHVHSKKGEGSMFSFSLPRVPAQIQVKVDCTEHDAVAPQEAGSILLIDDDQEILKAAKLLFEGWGYNIALAESYKEAEAFLQQGFLPDVVMSDYRLRHGRTGIEALNDINQNWYPGTPMLLISGDTDPDILKQAQQSNYPLLHKPFKPAKLKILLQNMMEECAICNVDDKLAQ